MAKVTFRQMYNHLLAAFPDTRNNLPCVLYDGDIEDEQTLETAIDIIDAYYEDISPNLILSSMLGQMNIGRPEEVKLFWSALMLGKSAAKAKINEQETELAESKADFEKITKEFETAKMELTIVKSAKFGGGQKG